MRWEAYEDDEGFAVEANHEEATLRYYYLDDSGWVQDFEYRVSLDSNGRLDKLSSTGEYGDWALRYTDSGYLSSFEYDNEIHDIWSYVDGTLQTYSYISDFGVKEIKTLLFIKKSKSGELK